MSALAGVLCPPRWACLPICLPICLPSGFVFNLGWGAVSASLGFPQTVYCWGSHCCLKCVRLGWGAVSASLGLSPNLSPIWLCLSPWLCPPRWSCLSLVCGLVSGLVCHLGWDAVSVSLGCLRSCLPACLPSGLGCSVRLPGLVSQLLSLFCLVACLSSGMLCLPPLGLSFSCLWSCLPACLGCCVRLLGSSPSPACLRSFVPSCFPAGLVCPCSGLVSKISCAICATVWGLRWCNFIPNHPF